MASQEVRLAAQRKHNLVGLARSAIPRAEPSFEPGFTKSGELSRRERYVMKLSRIILVCAVLFALCSVTFAAEYWVIKDSSGKMVIVESRPADQAVILKGPFPDQSRSRGNNHSSCPRRSGGAGTARLGPLPAAPKPPLLRLVDNRRPSWSNGRRMADPRHHNRR